MTDFVLRAADEADMRAAYSQAGILDADGQLIEGGEYWAVADVGQIDNMLGYWCVLRWNIDQLPPIKPNDIEIVWQTGDKQQYPAGVPMMA